MNIYMLGIQMCKCLFVVTYISIK